MQAHFDVAMEDFKEEQKQAHGWKQDEKTAGFLKALEGVEVKMEERYLREIIKKHKVFVLSTLAADQRSEEHTSELQSLTKLVCRLVLATKQGDEPSEEEQA